MAEPDSLPTFEEALLRVVALASPMPPETVKIDDAVGRGAAQALLAQRMLPPFDNSAMDGYALRSVDTQTLPVKLKIVERIFAGHQPHRHLQAFECARIMTGAHLPVGADAVVMQENVLLEESEASILVRKPSKPGENIRLRGEDTQTSELLFPMGTSLGIAEASLLWAQGYTEVQVPRRPKVGILSSGDELAPLGAEEETRIIDSNSPMLELAVRSAGGHASNLGVAKDHPESLREKLSKLNDFDVVLITGGVSVGEKDFTRDVLREQGITLHLEGVAIKPGKPLAVGTKEKTLIFALPGNPISAWVTFELFVRPALRRMLGHARIFPCEIPGHVQAPIKKKPGLTHFLRVSVEFVGNTLYATPTRTQSSGALTSGARASHLLKIPANVTELSPSDVASLIPLPFQA